ncbi:6-aminohexanoate-cyclic-dimer hydrolase [Austwickia sp. TVS 96-490-7B]|uniref:amidase n=1 Tax=Austwickia sp. TVS 96-490-7B TaxID=2830843 RepID=UPI001D6859C6|nr:amidase [Austwickia sp. TVS 96-490-7B]MBW3085295.1 6-aminohexanoate-cyclic-dimer hydrolase [Austwickia sp. TVS 96-490-7B]
MSALTPNDLAALSAVEVAACIRRGVVSAVEVAESTLAAIAATEDLGAFACVAAEMAVEQAERADAVVAAHPEVLPPLWGVPCPIKDVSPVRGLPHVAGSAAWRGRVATADSGVVRRLRQAGTVMVGKTSTPEFGLPCYTEPDVGVPARTPWDVRRGAGGSSGGAAAAVAAGVVPIAHGSDGGGSIRIPAAACGLVGMKPSRGLIGSGPWGVSGPGLASEGVLTRTVRDTAVALDVLSPGWPGDVSLFPAPRTTYLDCCVREVGSLRVGVLTTPIIADAEVHPAALRAVERAVRVLADLGHQVVEVPSPFPAHRWAAFAAIWSVSAASISVPEADEPLLVPLTRWLRERGRVVSGVEYARALDEAQLLARETAAAWAGVDVVVMPTVAGPPPWVGELRDDADPEADFAAQTRYTPYTSVANVTGRPAVSLPIHREVVDGVELPFGVMLMAELGADELLLSLSAQLEAADPWPVLARGYRSSMG